MVAQSLGFNFKAMNAEQNWRELGRSLGRWEHGIPLGSGVLGAVVWGEGTEIRVSLDRPDIWDLRCTESAEGHTWARLAELVAAGEFKKVEDEYEQSYREVFPTKLPVGRLVLKSQHDHITKFEWLMERGTARVHFGSGVVELSFHPTLHVLVVSSEIPLDVDIELPDYAGLQDGQVSDLGALGYSAGIKVATEKAVRAWQPTFSGNGYNIFAKWADVSETSGKVLFASVETSSVPLEQSLNIEQARKDSLAAHRAAIRDFWAQYWEECHLKIPDHEVGQGYRFAQFLYGAGTGAGVPPLALQGVWTLDNGQIPPWKGDYHHNLNTQFTYLASLTGNRFESHLAFLEFLWALLPDHQAYAREFYETSGACVPSVMSLNGRQMGGWAPYAYAPTNSAWLAHHFYLHWKFTADRTFLVERALPYLQEIGECHRGLLRPDAEGKLKLPLSGSPEIGNNRPHSYLPTMSNYDIALVRFLFAALVELEAEAGGDPSKWEEVLRALPELQKGSIPQMNDFLEGDVLFVAKDRPLLESHRHFSHLMAIYPLGIIHSESHPEWAEVIERSMLQLDLLGTGQWTGYSFAWAACLAARLGKGDKALAYLQIFQKAFVWKNGFHVNGDFKDLGFSAFKYEPMTLEGNFAFAEAVHEMLLQSWGGVIRLFPAIPGEWQDASFHQLRAQGGYKVSAKWSGGKIGEVKIEAGGPARLRIRNIFPFGYRWSLPFSLDGQDLIFEMSEQAILTGNV